MIDEKTIEKIRKAEIKDEFLNMNKIAKKTAIRPITNELAYRLKLKNRNDFIQKIVEYTSKGMNIFSIKDLTSISGVHRNQMMRCFNDWNTLKIFIMVDKKDAEQILKDAKKEGKTNKDYDEREVYYTLDLSNPILKPASDLFYK
jgi:hypothetical protein